MLCACVVARSNLISDPSGDTTTGLEVEQFDRIYDVSLCVFGIVLFVLALFIFILKEIFSFAAFFGGPEYRESCQTSASVQN